MAPPPLHSICSATNPVRCYADLLVWQRAMDVVEATYRLAARLPPGERFELSSQLRRAAVSIAANIAEGHGRASTKEFLWFLSVAKGSLMELETLAIAAERLGFVPEPDTEQFLHATAELSRMLAGLRRGLQHHRAVSGGHSPLVPRP
jgi:four helix bundle protein